MWYVVKNPPANAGDAKDTDLIPGSGRSLGVGNGNPLQYSCLENFMDREPGRLQYMGIAELDMTEQLNMSTCIRKLERLSECLHIGSLVPIPLSLLLSISRLESQALLICRKLERV